MKLRMKRKAMVILAAGMLMSAAAPGGCDGSGESDRAGAYGKLQRGCKYTGGGEGCNAADCGDWKPPGSGEEPSGLI